MKGEHYNCLMILGWEFEVVSVRICWRIFFKVIVDCSLSYPMVNFFFGNIGV